MRPGPRRVTFAPGPAALLVVALAISACAPAASATASPGTLVPTPASAVASDIPSATPGAAGSPTTGPSSSAPGASVAEDDALLAILPAEVEGIAVTAERAAFAEAARDPDFAAHVEAAVFPLVVREADLASGVVARLRPDTYSDAFFRDWRDAYDEGACAQAGGIVGRAEADLGGRTVNITSCAGGLLVYHVYLPERDVVVSIFSLGEGRLGEKVMEGLRP